MNQRISFIVFGMFVFVLSANTQIKVDFETDEPGTNYTGTEWETNGFSNIPWIQGSERAIVTADHSHNGEESLQVLYPKGGVGPQETGHQAPCGLIPADEYYVSYWLRFSENFSWGSGNKGGKLPGLSANERCSGGQTCDGTNGFTARFMWRENGRAVLYLYHMNKIGKYGDDYDLINAKKEKSYFPRREWINLIERVKINTGNNKDGEVQIWYNGEEVLNIKELQFVSNGDKIDAFYFSSFHGGADKSWSPENDCYIYFDDIVVSRDSIDVFPAAF